MNPTSTTGHIDCVRLTAEDVVNLLEPIYTANGRMACATDLILGSRAAVSQNTVDRLRRLIDELRSGAAARAELASLDPDRLMAGTSLWMHRRRLSAASAGVRATQRWCAGRTA